MIRYQALELDSHGNVTGDVVELEIRTYHPMFSRVRIKGIDYKIIRIDGWCYNGKTVAA